VAFAQLRGFAKGASGGSNTATHPITIPAETLAGDRITVAFSVDGAPTITVTTGSGWSLVGEVAVTTLVKLAVYTKIAAGDATDALTLTTSTLEQSSHVSYAHSAADAVTATFSSSSTTATVNADPPSHSPGSTADYVWIAICGHDSNTVVATAAPSGYTNLQTQAAATANGASISSATRELNAASENPGVFTSAAEQWTAATVAIAPAAAAGVTGTLAATETGSDTFAGSGAVAVTGALGAVETGADIFAGSGQIAVSGALAASEAGSDTFVATGTVEAVIAGTLAATETGADTFAGSGAVAISAALGAVEAGADSFAGSGRIAVSGALAASETGSDTFAGVGFGPGGGLAGRIPVRALAVNLPARAVCDARPAIARAHT
jgi:hypothetical protein